MKRLIDKDALVAEIERRKQKLLDHIICERDKEFACRTAHHLNRIIDFLNTLEVKEVNLELELANYNREFVDENGFFNTEHLAKHFFELGMAVNNKAQKGEEYG